MERLVTCYPMGEFGNVWLVELDLQGNIVWQNCYGGSVYELGGHILETDNGYVIAGVSNSNDGDVSGHHGQPGENGCDDIWVVKLDTVGAIVWQKSLGGSSYDFPAAMFLNDTGEIMIFGITKSIDGDVSGNHSFPDCYDLWMAKLSSDGTLMEQQCFGGTWDEHFNNHSVAKINDYRYILAAGVVNNTGDIQCTLHGNGDWDAWYFEIMDCVHYAPATPTMPDGPADVCTSSTNQSTYTTQAVLNAQDYFWELLPAESGTIEQTGTLATVTWNKDYKGTAWIKVLSSNDCGSSAWSDSFPVQIYSCVGISENFFTGIKVYPNPAKEYVIFESQHLFSGFISLTDIYGRPVAEVPVTSEKTVWDTRGVQPGVYLHHFNNGKNIASGKLMIVK